MKTLIPLAIRTRYLFGIAALGLLLSLAPSHAADQVTGSWLTASGNLVIEIARCGTPFCGKVVQVVADRSMQDASVEMATPAESVLGKTLLTEFVADGENAWTGKIYNRENGKTYRCQMSLLSPTELKVRPYVLWPIFGSTQVWHRMTKPVQSKQ